MTLPETIACRRPSTQTQVRTGGQIQTLAAQPTAAGLWLLSTVAAGGADDIPETSEIYIPAAAAAWLAAAAAALATTPRPTGGER